MTVQTLTDTAPANTTADPYVQPLLIQLGANSFAFHRNVDGVTHAESLRAPGEHGNCLNWVVGHVVATRQAWLAQVLGQPTVIDGARLAIYKRGSAPLADGVDVVPLEELVAAFDAAQGPLVQAMSRLTAERLAQPAPFSPVDDPQETLGSLVAKLAFHEGYHIGQTGVLRRLLGHAGGIA